MAAGGWDALVTASFARLKTIAGILSPNGPVTQFVIPYFFEAHAIAGGIDSPLLPVNAF
jgi:hypothetical protein